MNPDQSKPDTDALQELRDQQLEGAAGGFELPKGAGIDPLVGESDPSLHDASVRREIA